MKKHYALTVSESQLDVLASALDLYTRVHTGQWAEVAWTAQAPCECGDALDALARTFYTHLPANACYPIRSVAVDNRARVAYDLHAVIRYHLANESDPEGKHWSVYRAQPLLTSGEEPATIEGKGTK